MGPDLSHSRRKRGQLILLRHGESQANADGLFTGLLNVTLTPRGIAEAESAAAMLNRAQLRPQVMYTSELRRTIQTAEIVVAHLRSLPTTITSEWRLDERNYGALTGLSKAQVRNDFGEDQFHAWRRSVNATPPPLSDVLYTALKGFPPFDRLPPEALTSAESLDDVIDRITPFLADTVIPDLLLRRTVLVVGHGNSLRALCGVLDSLDDAALERLNIPTGQPLVYEFTKDLHPDPEGGTYLDPDAAHAAAISIANEGGT